MTKEQRAQDNKDFADAKSVGYYIAKLANGWYVWERHTFKQRLSFPTLGPLKTRYQARQAVLSLYRLEQHDFDKVREY